MRRLPPSELVRGEIEGLFTEGVEEGTNVLPRRVELGVRYLAQQALEQEQEDRLGRGRYERGEEHQLGWRDGYEDARLRTAEGEVTMRVPQVRGTEAPYRSELIGFPRRPLRCPRAPGHGDVRAGPFHPGRRGLLPRCDRGAADLEGRGLGDHRSALGGPPGLPLPGPLGDRVRVPVPRCGSSESLRRHGAKEGVLAAWCVTADGRKVLLHLAVGNKESEACWTEFLRSMVARGLRVPTRSPATGRPGSQAR